MGTEQQYLREDDKQLLGEDWRMGGPMMEGLKVLIIGMRTSKSVRHTVRKNKNEMEPKIFIEIAFI